MKDSTEFSNHSSFAEVGPAEFFHSVRFASIRKNVVSIVILEAIIILNGPLDVNRDTRLNFESSWNPILQLISCQ